MSLRPGTRLGPYEIEAPIGTGGMGQVFIFAHRAQTTEPLRSHDLGADGRFLILTPDDPPEKVTEIQVVLNWFEELKRLAPAEN